MAAVTETKTAECQCFDIISGGWYEASVLSTTPLDSFVRFVGFPRKTSDTTVKIEHIRPPEAERLLVRNTPVSRLQSSRLLKDDSVQFKTVGGDSSGVVKENDPFRATITTTEGVVIGYEDLLPAAASVPDDTDLCKQTDKLQHGKKRKSVKKDMKEPKEPKKKIKKKVEAKMLDSGAPQVTVSDVNVIIGNTGSSPLKIPLTDNELSKVKAKVDVWKEKSESAVTQAELKKIGYKLDTVATAINEMSGSVIMKMDTLSQFIQRNIISPHIPCTSSGNSINTSHASSVVSDISDSESDANFPGLKDWLFGEEFALSASISDSVPSLVQSVNLLDNSVVSSDIPSAEKNRVGPPITMSPPPIYKPKANIGYSTPPSTYTDLLACQDFPVYTSAFQDYSSIAYSSPTVRPQTSTIHQSSSVADSMSSQPATPLHLSNPVVQNQVVQSPGVQNSHADHNLNMIDNDLLQDIYRRSKTSITAYVSKLTTLVFSISEVRGRNVNGKQNKSQLDKAKVAYIKHLTFAWFPCPATSWDVVWQRQCVKAIDRTNRQRVALNDSKLNDSKS